ncbi:MAG: type II toxin-antitoxin system CcdA family antitoxin [Egibacteraceae bacterium]
MANKRKISITVDADLVEELESSPDEGLSSQINEAIREAIERRRHQRALRALLDRLDEEDGPLGPESEPEIQRYMQLMGGP